MAWPAPWRDRYCRRPTYSRPPTGRCGSPLLTRGVLRFDGTEWRLFTTADGLAAAEAYINFVETRDGALWVTCLGEGLSRFDGERWTIHKPMDVVWFVGVWLSQDGDLWTGVPSGRLARFDGRDWQTYSADQVQQILGPSSRGRRLDGMVTSDGVFWLSTDEVAARLDPAGPTRYRHPDGLFGGFEDPAGGVWFHTDHLAVHHRDGEWIGHTAADGFLDGEVYGAWQAANGDVWFVGTHSGETAVARRSGERWRVYTTADGLIDRIYVDAVTDSGQSFTYRFFERHFVETATGETWIGGAHEGQAAVCRLDGDQWQRHSLQGGRVTSGYAASDGTVWFGLWDGENTVDGGGLYRHDGDEGWQRYDEADGLTASRIYGIAEWPTGTLWVGTRDGLNRRSLTAAIEAPWWGISDFPETGFSRKMGGFVATEQGLWFDQSYTASPIVHRYDGEAFHTYNNREDGLTGVSNLHVSAAGDLWVSGPGGLSRFRNEGWSHFTADDGVIFESRDQVYWNDIHEMSDGSFWISSADGTVTHLPWSVHGSTPETHIAPSVDRVSSAGNILLQWSGRDQWDQTAPDEMGYEWRLDGVAWSAWTRRTDVTLTELQPGTHRFQVRAIKSPRQPRSHAR